MTAPVEVPGATIGEQQIHCNSQFQTLLNAAIRLHASKPIAIAVDATDLPKFLRDFRTLRFSFGQRWGRTNAIHKLASPDDLVLVQGDGPAYRTYYSIDAEVLSYTQLDRVKKVGGHPRIWVDDVNWFPSDFLPMMYLKCGTHAGQQFILL